MLVVRVLLLPLAPANSVGCRSSAAMAAAIDSVAAVGAEARRQIAGKLGRRGSPSGSGMSPCAC